VELLERVKRICYDLKADARTVRICGSVPTIGVLGATLLFVAFDRSLVV
jgi:hypothetical protein